MPLRLLLLFLPLFALFCSFFACEIEPFDPRGYRCEADLNCLPEYYCNKKEKICQLIPDPDGATSDGGEGVKEAAKEATKEPSHEPTPEKVTEPVPREPPPERRAEATPDK